jgi:D-serine deaminase-like pyridoxal phosphate-dependent protein
MERPIFKPIGTPVEELDTPALVVDLDRFAANVETVHGFFAGRPSSIRPFVGTHRCPALAQIQMSVDGHAGGVAVGTVGQAEAFVDAGINDVFITGKVVTPIKIAALCALAKRATVSIAVDTGWTVDTIATAATDAGVEIDLLLELDTGLGLTGVEPGESAVKKAKHLDGPSGVRFAGLTTYTGPSLVDGQSTGVPAGVKEILDTRKAIEAAGLPVERVSVGSTGDYEAVGAVDGVTEVIAGNYALVDARYEGRNPGLEASAMVMGTVASLPVDGLAVGDAGMKTSGNDTGLPRVVNVPGAEVIYLSAEHFNLDMTKSSVELSIGDKVWFVPHDIAVTANHFDYIMGARDGRLDGIFDVIARGRYR